MDSVPSNFLFLVVDSLRLMVSRFVDILKVRAKHKSRRRTSRIILPSRADNSDDTKVG